MIGLRGRFVRPGRLLLAAGACAAVALSQSAVASASSRSHHDFGHPGRGDGALYVSPAATGAHRDRSCESAAYSTIQSAVTAAPAGATVVVCPGAYAEDVIVSAPLTLRGLDATIHGSPTANGMCDQLGATGPGSAPCLAGITIKSSDVKVSGFTVTGAIGEGILATGSLAGGSISDIVIRNNRVVANDTGGLPGAPASAYPQCAAVGGVPGDCGEAIHLMGVADSQVSGNFVSGNTGGVLLTDEFGPTHDNVVERNVITRNLYDCGVTVPGHNPFALNSSGVPQPAVAGDYDNVIRHNWITDNGLNGEGAGVLFANATAGTASYDNLVEDNYIAGNELSGVTMHAHTVGPGQFEDLNGNTIVRNVIGRNNIGSAAAGPGDPLDGPPATDPSTTGILVFSGTVPVQVTIAHNVVFGDHYGVWLGVGSNVSAALHGNRFANVTVPVFMHP
ncbi:MAG TPA: right-handed parallel beta-helix repeat-containing protein [Solirubrobacteraceae bacterium]